MGEGYLVQTNEEQHKEIYKLIKMEKLVASIVISLIIIVGSMNIAFSLMMLAFDKKKDISILSAVGANSSMIKKIFLLEGALISFMGAGLGLFLGGGICWLQDRFGLIGLGIQNSIVASYPVKLEAVDFLSVSLLIVVMTFLISLYPASVAARSFSTKHL
jgi:lipoprotein-releasing system permease protein